MLFDFIKKLFKTEPKMVEVKFPITKDNVIKNLRDYGYSDALCYYNVMLYLSSKVLDGYSFETKKLDEDKFYIEVSNSYAEYHKTLVAFEGTFEEVTISVVDYLFDY